MGTAQRWICWRTRMTALVLAGTAWAMARGAPLTMDDESSVKAAFLYNFTKFAEWPADKFTDPNSPIVIGIVGDDSLARRLQKMVEAKTVDGRSIVVRRLSRADEMAKCHVLFIARAGTEATKPFLPRLLDQHVLVVTDVPSLGDAIINFRIVNGSVRFEINADAARTAGLKLSSKLFAVAIK